MQNPPTTRPRKRQSTTLVFAICAPLILFSINLPPRTTAWSFKSHFPEYPIPPFSKSPHVSHSPPHSLRDSLHRRGNLQPQSATEPDTATPILRLRDPPPRSRSARMRPGPHRLLAHSCRAQCAVSSSALRRRRARLHATDAGVVRDHDTVSYLFGATSSWFTVSWVVKHVARAEDSRNVFRNSNLILKETFWLRKHLVGSRDRRPVRRWTGGMFSASARCWGRRMGFWIGVWGRGRGRGLWLGGSGWSRISGLRCSLVGFLDPRRWGGRGILVAMMGWGSEGRSWWWCWRMGRMWALCLLRSMR